MENPLSRLTRADIPIILPKEFSFPHSRDGTIVPKRIFMNNPQSAQAIADLPDEDLLSQLDPDVLPRHIAIIMDGNGRWAKRQGLPRMAGHREGLTSLRQVLDTCYELDIPILTIYAFSQENWNRPEQEIDILMALLEEFLHQERQTFQDRQMRFLPIGRLQALPPSAQALVHEIEAETKHFTKQVLCVALSYGGRSEIIDAINHLIQDVQAQRVSTPVTETIFEDYLTTAHLPDPDLLIRTSGEARISNFLLWQIAYAELYFTQTLWPEFRRREVLMALLDFQKRERRFGRVTQTVSHQSKL